jgi:hypothetical protein
MPKRVTVRYESMIVIDTTSSIPLYRQLYDRLRLAILSFSEVTMESDSIPQIEWKSHFTAARMVVFVVPDAESGKAPNRAIATVFSSAGIYFHRRAGAELHLEVPEHRLRIRRNPVQQFHQFAQADLKAMQIPKHVSQLAQPKRLGATLCSS